MRTFPVISVFTALAVHGAESDASAMHQKIHDKIRESLPPLPPPALPVAPKEDTTPPIMMAPLVVTETKRSREIAAAIDGDKQTRKEEAFTLLDGGRIFHVGIVQFGSWWSPGEGWTFLRLTKAPTPRQLEASQLRMKELNELLTFDGKTKP